MMRSPLGHSLQPTHPLRALSGRSLFADPAVRWLALSRMVALTGAPLTLWLVLQFLEPSERGFWVVALNLMALGPMVELGVGSLLVQFVTHANSRNRQALWASAQQWYARAAVAIAVASAMLGILFLPHAEKSRFAEPNKIAWWLSIVIMVAAYVRLVPRIAFWEGEGQRLAVQRMRTVQAVCMLATLLLGLTSGLRLNALVPAAVCQWLIAYFALKRLPEISDEAAAPSENSGASSHIEIKTHFQREQARSVVLWMLLWLAPQALTPALLARGDLVDAGKLGISIALALAPSTLSGAWLQGRLAEYGTLVAAGHVVEFERRARQSSVQALAVQIIASVGLFAFVVVAGALVPALRNAVLSTFLLALLVLGNTCFLVLQAALAWGRAFRDESLSIPASIGLTAMIVVGVAVSMRIGVRGSVYSFVLGAAAASLATLVSLRRLRKRKGRRGEQVQG